MPKAEVGSTKAIANMMKSKGLQRLRWFCQACSRQMRDENGFKCHVASESHVRNMMLIGEDPRKAINDYSQQFQRDFLQLLRTGHGEKKVNINHFYQEYISNKQHVHMNATKWTSLTEFAKFLGREGICRVEEDERSEGRSGAAGLCIAWIDNSPEALRRQDALKKKERQDRGDEEREQRAIREQIRKARRNNDEQDEDDDEDEDDLPAGGGEGESEGIKRKDGEKIVLSFTAKKAPEAEKPPSPPLTDQDDSPGPLALEELARPDTTTKSQPQQPSMTKPISLSVSASKPKNVFAAIPKKNTLANAKKQAGIPQQKTMSEAERIMKEELERKRRRESVPQNFKKQKVS